MMQISPEEVKALDAQWKDLALRSDMPVIMDDIQEVAASAVSSPQPPRHSDTLPVAADWGHL